MIEIKNIINEHKGYFAAYSDDKEAGRMSYTMSGEAGIIIDHTEVNKEFNGKGIGKMLVMNAVEYARKNNKKIIPLCPFTKSVFDKVEEIRDVLS